MSYIRPVLAYGANNALDDQSLTLAADTVVSVTVPSAARMMKIRVPSGDTIHYTLDGTDPTNTIGFPISGGTHNTKIAGGITLKLFETGGATTAYIQFFGGDVETRIRGGHDSLTVTSTTAAPLLDMDADADDYPNALKRGNATEIRARGNVDWAYTLDGTAPDGDTGIEVDADQNVWLPCRGASKVQVISRGASLTLQAQAFEDRRMCNENNLAPVGSHVYEELDASVFNVAVPGDANLARISAEAQSIRYTVNGVDPTADDSFSVSSGGTTTVDVSPGGFLKFLRGADGAKLNVAFFSF